MADKKQLLKRFILEWKIKNYSSCVEDTEGLKSQTFPLRRPRSSWQLEVRVGDRHEIQVCLCRQFMTDGPPVINVRFLLCLKTLHGPDIWRYESGWLRFMKDRSFVSIPLILETIDTMVVTCVMLIMDQPRPFDPNVECLYREIKSLFSNDGGTKNTNATLVVGEQKKRIKVHKEMLSTHSAMFDGFYRHNDGEFEILCYSPEVIVSILTFFYSGDITLLAKDKNIFELLSCASALGFSCLINTLRSEFVVTTSEYELRNLKISEPQDITFKWNCRTLRTDSWFDNTGLRIFPLYELRCSMAFQTEIHVDMTSGQTSFSIEMWPLPAESLCSSFCMDISVCDNDGCIHLNKSARMHRDYRGIYRLKISIENYFLFGTDKVSFPRHVNFKSNI